MAKIKELTNGLGVHSVIEADDPAEQLARQLLVAKYADTEDDLDAWGRTSFDVVIDFPADCRDENVTCAQVGS